VTETEILRDEIAAAMAQLPPWPPDASADDDATREIGDGLAAVEAELTRLGEHAHPALSEACHRLVSLIEQHETATDRRLRRRLDTLAAVHMSLARLRELRSVEAIIARASREACVACGFDRAVIYRVHGSELIAESFYVSGDPETAARLLEFSRDQPLVMEQGNREREMIRRRMPMCVHDVMTDPHGFHPQAEVYDTHSYVAAPILPEGRVIGFVHADHRLKPRRVDDFDRDALWAFAEGLGFAIERARLTERLRAQGEELQRLLHRAQTVVSDYLDAEVEIVSSGEVGNAAARTAEALLGGAEAENAVEAALSRREREVLVLLAKGASNAQIAAQLVIADETAKTHVKRILRKLGVTNRVEAATMWLRAQQGE
jgi:DNA-binding CsgD family transcriptional regulator/GAF domain-containing protein